MRTPTDACRVPVLEAVVNEYAMSQDEFIATKVMPVCPTNAQAAKISVVGREDSLRVVDTRRAPGSEYKQDSGATKVIQYTTEEHGLEDTIGDDQTHPGSVKFVKPENVCLGLASKLLRSEEARASATLFDTAVFTGADLFVDNSSTPWTSASVDVIGQIRSGIEKVRLNSGVAPNALIINPVTLNRMKNNAAVLEAVKYTDRPSDAVVYAALSDLLGLKKVFVGKATKNAAEKGQKLSGAYLWSSLYAMLAVIPDDASDLCVPALSRTMSWQEDAETPYTVEKYRHEKVRGDVYRVRQNVDEFLCDKYFGLLMKVATA